MATKEIETKKVAELKPFDNLVQMSVEVIEVGEERTSDSGISLQDTIVGDESGSVKMTLFEDKVGTLDVGDKICLKHCYVKNYNGTLSLNLKNNPSSSMELLEKGDGTTKLKAAAKKLGANAETGMAIMRQSALKSAAQIHSNTSASPEDVIKTAETFLTWLLHGSEGEKKA